MKWKIAWSLFVAASLVPAALFAVPKAKKAYADAHACYVKVKADPMLSEKRSEWEKCVSDFAAVSDKYRKSKEAGDALYNEGKLRREMYNKFSDKADAEESVRLYNRVVKEYPKSEFAGDSLYQIAVLRLKPFGEPAKAKAALEYLVANYPKSDKIKKANEMLGLLGDAESVPTVAEGPKVEETPKAVETPPPAEKVKIEAKPEAKETSPFKADVAGPFDATQINAISVKGDRDRTVVQIDFSRPVAYSVEFTEEGKRTRSPPKLEATFSYAKPSRAVEKDIRPESSHVSEIKIKKQLLGGGTTLSFTMAPATAYDVKAKGNSIFITFRPEGQPAKRSQASSEAKPAAAPTTDFVSDSQPQKKN